MTSPVSAPKHMTRAIYTHTTRNIVIAFCVIVFCLLPSLAGAKPATTPPHMSEGINTQLMVGVGQKGADLGMAVDPRAIVVSYVQTLLQAASVLCILLIVYSGYMFFIARGDESKVDNAKKTLRYTIIGLIIILAAYSITLIASRIISTAVQGEEYRQENTRIRFEGFTPTEAR